VVLVVVFCVCVFFVHKDELNIKQIKCRKKGRSELPCGFNLSACFYSRFVCVCVCVCVCVRERERERERERGRGRISSSEMLGVLTLYSRVKNNSWSVQLRHCRRFISPCFVKYVVWVVSVVSVVYGVHVCDFYQLVPVKNFRSELFGGRF